MLNMTWSLLIICETYIPNFSKHSMGFSHASFIGSCVTESWELCIGMSALVQVK